MSSSSLSEKKKKITLTSSDGEAFEVDEAVALESPTIKKMIEDNCAGTGVPLPDVTSKILAKVIEYCKKHVEAQATNPNDCTSEYHLKAWDAEFVQLDGDTLFDLVRAVHSLKIKNLMDLTCQTTVDMITGKTPEEIRRTFNIMTDVTPEEEEEIRRQNQWVFE